MLLIFLEDDAHRHALDHLDPVARGVLGRQQRKNAARARRETLDRAVIGHGTAVHVGRNQGGLADAHALELAFLEIGIHPETVQRHHGQQGLAGRDVLAHLHGASGHLAAHRAAYGSALQIQPALAHGRGRFPDGGLFGHRRVQQHGGQGVALGFGHGQGVTGRGHVFDAVDEFLLAHGLVLDQLLASLQVALLALQVDLAHGDVGFALAQFGFELAGFAHGRGQADQGVLISQAGVHRINGHQGLSGFHPVCVVGQHRRDPARHLGHDRDCIARNIGVVRVFLVAQHQGPPDAPGHARGQKKAREQEQNARPAAGPQCIEIRQTALLPRLRLCFRLILRVVHKTPFFHIYLNRTDRSVL